MSNDKHVITYCLFMHPWTIIDTHLYFLENLFVAFDRICATPQQGSYPAEKVILVIKGRWLFWNLYKVHFTIVSIYKTIIMRCLNGSSTMRAKTIFKLFIVDIFMAKWISKFAFSKLNNWFCILTVGVGTGISLESILNFSSLVLLTFLRERFAAMRAHVWLDSHVEEHVRFQVAFAQVT